MIIKIKHHDEHSSHSHADVNVSQIHIPLELKEIPSEYMEKTIHVMVCKGSSGEVIRAEICLADTAQQGIFMIADQINYVTEDPDKIGLFNMSQDFEYRMDERFYERKTNEGDLLFMVDGGACHK